MKLSLTLGIAMICLSSVKVMAQDKETMKLRVIETTDVHGSFFPYDFIERKPLKGSLTRVSTYVNRLRKEYGNRLLLLDNGDILQGQPTCYYTNFVKSEKPNIAAEVINYMKYDVETMGNHDVETGHAVYDKWIREVRCPLLGANILMKESGLPYLPPYSIHEIGKTKVAVLGMITPAIPFWLKEPVWSGLEFQDMVACAKQWVDYINKEEQPDVLIGLFHSGKDGGISTPECEENLSAKVAKEVPGFDIVFFGHDHIVHNDWIVNVKGDSVLCLDPANNAQRVADAQIELTYENGKLTGKRVEGKIQSIADEDVDEEMLKHFQATIDSVKQYVERQIGFFENKISSRDCFFGSAAFTDLIHNIQLTTTGADISFTAPLSFNTSIEQGPFHVSDLFKLYRFENLVTVLTMTGSEVRKHLEMSYDLWINTMTKPDDHILRIKKGAFATKPDSYSFIEMTFNFDSAAGIDYEVDVTKKYGERVRILRMSNGEPFDEQKTYKVVMNSYRSNGGGELLTKGAGIPHDEIAKRIIYQSERDQRHYLMQEIEKVGHIAPKANNNWRFVPTEWAEPALKRDRKLIFNE